MKTINVAIIGIGTVGKGVIEILEQNKDLIFARTGAMIVPKIGVARTITNKNVTIPLSTNIDEVLNDAEIDVVVELIGGIELPYQIALKTLKNKKSFVTANKAMLAYHRHELEALAKDSSIGFEASVCGGIPIIRVLRDGLCANHILSIRGILNGTSNYILSQMDKNIDFHNALKQAQDLGYAEADPALDINGSDSAHKLLILASLAYGFNAKMEDIIIEGINDISLEDINFAREHDYAIKLLGIAKKHKDEVELRVHLCMIPKDSMLAKTNGAMNAISVIGDKVGESVYYGAGAGGSETASSVVSDIIDIARNNNTPMLGYAIKSIGDNNKQLKLMSKNKIESCYYLRIKVEDKPGVLSHVTNILANNNISIESFMQHNPKHIHSEHAFLLLSTYMCLETQIQLAITQLEQCKEVIQKPFMMRIEDV